RQHRPVGRDAGAGGQQQVARVGVGGLQAEAAVRAAGVDHAAQRQFTEQPGGGATLDIAHRDLDALHRRTAIADGGHRITALGRRTVVVVEVHLQELARLERQRLAVDALENEVTHRGSEHEAVSETELEVVGHGVPETVCASGRPGRQESAQYNKRLHHLAQPMSAPHTDSPPALVVDNLRKTYRNGVEALKGVSLTVQPGDFFALLGPNGAGKSTLIGILSSLVNSTGGDAQVFGVSVNRQRSEAMKLIGLVPQEINFNQFEKPFDICVNEAGFYGIPRKIAAERAEKYLKELRLWDKAQHQARMLSGGMKRRLMIARAMMNEPRLLILDEPTAGVDIEIRRSMWQFVSGINAAGTTVILTTHYLEEAES